MSIRTTFFRCVLLAVIVSLAVCSATFAQRGGGGGGGRGGRGGGGFGLGGPGGFGGGGGAADIALRDDVKKELDITESQAGDIQKIAEESRSGAGNDMRARFAEFQDMSAEERQEAMQKLQVERQKQQLEVRKDVLAVLNSRQRDRFEQIEFQYYVDRGNAESAIAAAKIELSDAEREKLAEAQRNMQNELQARMAEIRRDLQMEVLESVVSKSKIESLMGEKFTFEGGNGPQFGRGGGRQRGGGGAAAGPAAGGQNRRRNQAATPSSQDDSNDSSSGTPSRNRRRGQ